MELTHEHAETIARKALLAAFTVATAALVQAGQACAMPAEVYELAVADVWRAHVEIEAGRASALQALWETELHQALGEACELRQQALGLP